MANAKKKEVEHRHGTLTVQDRFYIENNGHMSVEELADMLKQPIDTIQSYCDEWLRKNPQNAERPANKLMDRPRKGVVAMTGGASSAADDNYNKYVTIEALNKAIMDGNVERVKYLKEELAKQDKTRKDIIKQKYVDKIHYIIPLGDDDEAL